MSQAAGSLSETEFIAFDLETTGLHPVASKIVEIGAIRFRGDGKVLDQFAELVDPCCEIPADVIEIHGITNAMVAGQPPIDEVLPRFVQFLGDAPVVLMAHNAGFDVGFLAVNFSRLGHPPPSHPIIDTCALARRRLSLPNYKLETIGRHLALIEEEKHRALDDAVLLKDIFLYMIGQSPAVRRVDDLYDLTSPLEFEMFTTLVTHAPPGFDELWLAISEEQPIELEYLGGSNPGTIRIVTPRGVMQTRGQIYLSAYCHESKMEKTYRLDRIASYRRTN